MYYLLIHIIGKPNNYNDFVIKNGSTNVNDQITEEEINEISQINGVKNVLLEKTLYQFINMTNTNDKLAENGVKNIEQSLKFDKLVNVNDYRNNNYYYMLTQIKEYDIQNINRLKSIVLKGNIDDEKFKNEPVCILVQNVNNDKVTKYKVGDKISITPEICRKENGLWIFPVEIELTIAAILNEKQYECDDGSINTVVIVSRNVSEKYMNKPGYYKIYDANKVKIDIKNEMFFDKVKLSLESIISRNRNLQLFTSEDLNRDKDMTNKRTSMMYICLAIAMCMCGVLSIFSIMFMNVMLRKKEYALLMAIGMSDKQLKSLIITEALIYGLEGIKKALIIGSIGIIFEYMWIKTQTDIICIYPFKFVVIMILGVFLICFLAAVNTWGIIVKDEITTAIQAVE